MLKPIKPMVSTAVMAHLGSLLSLCHHPTTTTLQHAHRLLWQAGKPRIIRVGHQDVGSELPSLTPCLPSLGFHHMLGSPGPSQLRVPGWHHPLGCPTSEGPTGFAWRTNRAHHPQKRSHMKKESLYHFLPLVTLVRGPRAAGHGHETQNVHGCGEKRQETSHQN